jgi:hypothetical protein
VRRAGPSAPRRNFPYKRPPPPQYAHGVKPVLNKSSSSQTRRKTRQSRGLNISFARPLSIFRHTSRRRFYRFITDAARFSCFSELNHETNKVKFVFGGGFRPAVTVAVITRILRRGGQRSVMFKFVLRLAEKFKIINFFSYSRCWHGLCFLIELLNKLFTFFSKIAGCSSYTNIPAFLFCRRTYA